MPLMCPDFSLMRYEQTKRYIYVGPDSDSKSKAAFRQREHFSLSNRLTEPSPDGEMDEDPGNPRASFQTSSSRALSVPGQEYPPADRPPETGVDEGSVCELRDHVGYELPELKFEFLWASIKRIVTDRVQHRSALMLVIEEISHKPHAAQFYKTVLIWREDDAYGYCRRLCLDIGSSALNKTGEACSSRNDDFVGSVKLAVGSDGSRAGSVFV
ncbi:hypothetical protein HG530_005404 [Fusarium avenaceum]|nr:hypothetical protein HG530_005404 [Fusarium avenaceum]